MTARRLVAQHDYFCNVRGIVSKLPEIDCFLCENEDRKRVHPDIICHCKTFLSETIPDIVLSMENYSSYRYDRKSHGGGLLMYVRSSIVVTTVHRISQGTVPGVPAMLLEHSAACM